MGPLTTARQVFSLDTLDTRLTAKRHTSSPPKPQNTPSLDSLGPGSSTAAQRRRPRLEESTNPSLWNTPEFYLYYVVIGIAVPYMFKVAHDVSKESHPNFPKYKHLLSAGWIPGRLVDNSDAQYRSFRNNIPTLFSVLVLHFVLRHVYNFVYNRIFPVPSDASSYRPLHNLNRRRTFDIVFSLTFLFILYGFSLLKILVIILINFSISYFHPSSIWNPVLTWAFNLGVLFGNEYFKGYKFKEILPFLIAGEGEGIGYWMDHFMGGGMLRRWEISFNITVLRLISYNLDHYWAAKAVEDGGEEALGLEGSVIEVGDITPTSGESAERTRFLDPERGADEEWSSRDVGRETPLDDDGKKRADPQNISEHDRITTPHPLSSYSLPNYISYVLYTPLYLAGPILTFNDHIHQALFSTPSLSIRRTALYAVRLVASLLCMELMLHYLYVVAISKTASLGSWLHDTPFQLAMIGYFNLHIIWLKLMIPWRFFRLWSLVDGIDPPENMIRCMSNNHSALAFWRGWHRSFNRWTVRYVYVPLGGARRPIINMLAVFTFVALWHDISLNLLMWGWLIVFFVLPEMLAKKVVTLESVGGNKRLFRNLSALGGVANTTMMMAANLVGFAIGWDGLKELVKGVVGTLGGLGFLCCAVVAVFMAIQVMMEIREGEKRRGVDLRC